MANHDITHSCGHRISHQIYGKLDQRAGRADWLASQPCQDCRRASDLAAATEATSDLPTLSGSLKQVEWATRIRADAHSAITALIPAGAALNDQQRAALDWLYSRPAGWWIDRREHGKSGRTWLGEAQRGSAHAA